MLKMRSLAEIASPSTISEKVMVATPLGPKPGHEALGRGVDAGSDQRQEDRHRPGQQERDGHNRDCPQAVAQEAAEGEQRAEDDEDPELDDLDDVVRALLE